MRLTPRFRHAVWDWNGTLLDDAGLCADIMNGMLSRRGLPPITPDFYRAAIEFPVETYYEKLGFDFTQTPFEEASDEFVRLYGAGWRRCRLHGGAAEALSRLAEAGIGQSVLSASKQEYLEEQLQYFGVAGFLCALTGAADHHGRGKRRIARAHLEALGLAAESVLFVGDTRHDAEAAAEAGCACLLVSFGHYSAERLACLGLPVANGFSEIMEFILSAAPTRT